MNVIKIYQEMLPFHPLLGRNFRFDSRSAAFPFKGDGLSLKTTFWQRHIGPLDQGQLGSCTGNSGIGNMATGPLYDTYQTSMKYSLTEDGAIALYSAATALDSFPGQYPPSDTGSDGTAVGAALKAAGMISGYTHAADGPAARLALTTGPIIVGIKWYNNMFTNDSDGRVRVDTSSGLAGGHELSFDGVDVENGRVWFTNSWGASWGVTRDDVAGRAFFTFDDFDRLIADQGDAQVLVPVSVPAPTPTPPSPQPGPTPNPVDDAGLWQVAQHFTTEHHYVPEYRKLSQALHGWGVGKGFTS